MAAGIGLSGVPSSYSLVFLMLLSLVFTCPVSFHPSSPRCFGVLTLCLLVSQEGTPTPPYLFLLQFPPPSSSILLLSLMRTLELSSAGVPPSAYQTFLVRLLYFMSLLRLFLHCLVPALLCLPPSCSVVSFQTRTCGLCVLPIPCFIFSATASIVVFQIILTIYSRTTFDPLLLFRLFFPLLIVYFIASLKTAISFSFLRYASLKLYQPFQASLFCIVSPCDASFYSEVTNQLFICQSFQQQARCCSTAVSNHVCILERCRSTPGSMHSRKVECPLVQ